jgi:hypothetical protein
MGIEDNTQVFHYGSGTHGLVFGKRNVKSIEDHGKKGHGAVDWVVGTVYREEVI